MSLKEESAGRVLGFPVSTTVPQEPQKPRTNLDAYERLATSLGFEPAELIRLKLIRFFAQNDIQLLDYGTATSRLHATQGPGTNPPVWWWKPLRDQDMSKEYAWGARNKSDFYSAAQAQCLPSNRCIPFGTLKKVALIESRFPGKINVFVSHHPEKEAERLIMVLPVSPYDGEHSEYALVFDTWTESDIRVGS